MLTPEPYTYDADIAAAAGPFGAAPAPAPVATPTAPGVQTAGPFGVPQAAAPEKPGIMQMLVPALVAAFGPKAGPRGTAAMIGGFLKGQEARRARTEHVAETQMRRANDAAKFRMQALEQVATLPPEQQAVYIDALADVGQQLYGVDLRTELGAMQQAGQPALERAATAKQRSEAAAIVESNDKARPGENWSAPDETGQPKPREWWTTRAGRPGLLTATPKPPADGAALGSFEDYVKRKFGPNPTPDQIEQGRKAYQQADDRPRVTVNNAERPMTQGQRLNAIRSYQRDWNRAVAPVMDRQQQTAKLDSGLAALQRGNRPAATEIILIAFQKMQDETSVVRETEYGRPGEMQSLRDRVSAAMTKLVSGGSNMTDDALRTLADEGKRLAAEIEKVSGRQLADYRQAIEETLAEAGIPSSRVFGQSRLGIAEASATTETAGQPKEGDVKPIPGYPGTEQTYRNGKWIRTK